MTPEQEERLVAALELIAQKIPYQSIYGMPAQPLSPPQPLYPMPWITICGGEVVEINTAAALTK